MDNYYLGDNKLFPRFLPRMRQYIWFILLLFSSSTMARSDTLEHVALQLKWFHQFQSAGYYAAIEQGYYRAAGLHVHLVAGTWTGIWPGLLVLAGSLCQPGPLHGDAMHGHGLTEPAPGQ